MKSKIKRYCKSEGKEGRNQLPGPSGAFAEQILHLSAVLRKKRSASIVPILGWHCRQREKHMQMNYRRKVNKKQNMKNNLSFKFLTEAYSASGKEAYVERRGDLFSPLS